MYDYMLESFSNLPIDSRSLSEGLNEYINEQMNWCYDENFSANFPFKETGLPQDFFLQKIIKCDGNEYLTGPRYIGGNLAKPFIDVVASSAPVTRRAANAIMSAWQPMGAKSLRILRIPKKDARGSIDQYFYADSCSNKTGYLNSSDSLVRLELATPDLLKWCLDTLNESYKETYLKFPHLQDKVLPVDEEDMQDAINGHCAYIIISGECRVGFIICEQFRRAFVSGNWIVEEVVLPAFRGKRLAGMAQRSLLASLRQPNKISSLWGTIESNNIPSLRAAEFAGRKKVMEYVFLKDGEIND